MVRMLGFTELGWFKGLQPVAQETGSIELNEAW